MCFASIPLKNHLPSNTRDKILSLSLIVLLIVEISFIFSNSVATADVSSGKSGVFVTFFIEKILGIDSSYATDELVWDVTHFIRKTAHFCEFALLSATFSSLLLLFRVTCKKLVLFSTMLSFLIGCVDEFIQLFSEGRACRFTDALIDTSGGFFGALFVVFIVIVVTFLHKKSKKK